jgi:putative glutamine amidotransferase
MPPIIGVVACRALPDYLESVQRAGAETLVLDPAADRIEDLLPRVNAVLLTGGGDIDPGRYGEQPQPSVSGVEPQRDEFELALVLRATEAGLPLFGICRGMQVLNVALGGTLYQDLPSQAPSTLEHSKPTPRCAIAHEVWVTQGTRLAAMMTEKLAEADACPVNSRHHQAVRRLADGFEATATAPDGIIEAIEHRHIPFCVGVQWHPENFWRTGEFRELFEGFIEVARKRQ